MYQFWNFLEILFSHNRIMKHLVNIWSPTRWYTQHSQKKLMEELERAPLPPSIKILQHSQVFQKRFNLHCKIYLYFTQIQKRCGRTEKYQIFIHSCVHWNKMYDTLSDTSFLRHISTTSPVASFSTHSGVETSSNNGSKLAPPIPPVQKSSSFSSWPQFSLQSIS